MGQPTAVVLVPCTVSARPAHANHKCSPLPSCSPGVAIVQVVLARAVLATPLAHWRAQCAAVDLRAVVELHKDELHLSKQQGDIALKAHVASICFKCLICFRGMLQVFQIDIVKVDRDIAYVAMVVHVCYKGLFQCFICVSDVCCKCFIWMLRMFHTYVASVSCGCCICFTYMLQIFHLDVAYVLQWLHTCFPDVCYKCFNCFWTYVASVFHLDVTKVDLVLHML
jgi:hypothetical protein